MRRQILEQIVLLVLCHVAAGRKTFKLKVSEKQDSDSCTLPTLPEGVTYHRNSDGTRIFFDCYSGFKTLGAEYADCKDGEWSNEPPLCIARRCPVTYSLTHGRVSLSYSGALVRYSCDAPYAMEGDSVLVCDGRKWNGTVPKCVEPGSRGNKISYGKGSAHKTHVDWLEESDYSCVKRKGSIRPPKISYAQSHTKWTLTDGKPRLYTLYRCQWGYVARGESKYMYCKNGEWTGAPPKCIKAETTAVPTLPRDQSSRKSMSLEDWLELADYTCMGTAVEPQRVAPEPVTHGNYVLRYSMVDGTPRLYAMMRCDFGFKLDRKVRQNMYCKEKSWIGPRPKCVVDEKAEKRNPLDTCDYNNGGCAHTCLDGRGGVTCGCRQGYQLDSDGRSCVDEDECITGNGGCEQTCRNSEGSFQCMCHGGYLLTANGKDCEEAPFYDEEDLKSPMALFHV